MDFLNMLFNKTSSIVDQIKYQALITPEALAIKSKHWGLTYVHLITAIESLKLNLYKNGAAKGMTVSVALDSARFNTFLLSLALLDLGCVYVANSATKENAVVPDLMITDAISQNPLKQILFDPSWFEEAPSIHEIPNDRHSFSTALFGTSGSVGTPKVIALSEEQLLMRVQSHCFGLGHAVINRAWGTLLGPSSLFGYLSYLSPLIRGGTLVLNSGSTVDENSNLEAIEHLTLSPQILALFLDDENLNMNTFKNLKSIMVSGSAISQTLLDKAFTKLRVEIYSSYGSTEVGPVANLQHTPKTDKHDAVGYVYPWVELEIVQDNAPLKIGQEGLIRIRSAYMSDHYHEDQKSTNRSYKDGWFYPGDLGRLTGDRLLHVTGRVSEVINIGGLKISPHKIEEFVRTLPQIRDVAAFSNTSESGLDQVALAVVTSGPIDFTELHQKCVERFGSVAAPVRVFHVTNIPRTETGKIQRARLKALLTQDTESASIGNQRD